MPPERATGTLSVPTSGSSTDLDRPSSVVAVEMTPIVPVRVFNASGEYFDTETHLYAPMKILQWAIEDFFKVKMEAQQLLYNREPVDPTRSLYENGCLLLKGEPYVKIVFTIKRGPLLNIVCHWSRTHEEVPIACLESSTIAEVKQILYDELLQRHRHRCKEEESARQDAGRKENSSSGAPSSLPPPPRPPLSPSQMRILWRYMELNDKATLDYYRVPTNAAFFVLRKRGSTSVKQIVKGTHHQGNRSSRSATRMASVDPSHHSVALEEHRTASASLPESQEQRLYLHRGSAPPKEREVIGSSYTSSQYPSAPSITVVPPQIPASAPPPIAATAPTPPPPLPPWMTNPSHSPDSTQPNYRMIQPLPPPPLGISSGFPPPHFLTPSASPPSTDSPSPTSTWWGREGIPHLTDPRLTTSPSWVSYPSSDGIAPVVAHPTSMGYSPFTRESSSGYPSPAIIPSFVDGGNYVHPSAARKPEAWGAPSQAHRSGYPSLAAPPPPPSVWGSTPVPHSSCLAAKESTQLIHTLQNQIYRLEHELHILRQHLPPTNSMPSNFFSSSSEGGASSFVNGPFTKGVQIPKVAPFSPLGDSSVPALRTQEHAGHTLQRIEQLESSVKRLHKLLESVLELVR